MLTVDSRCCQGSSGFNGEKVNYKAPIWQEKRKMIILKKQKFCSWTKVCTVKDVLKKY